MKGRHVRKANREPLLWVWEFSKRLVLICSALYVISFFYSCAVMYQFQDFSYLGTFISESSDILKTCVFGYFVKAGVENVLKIKNNKKESEDQNNAEG